MNHSLVPAPSSFDGVDPRASGGLPVQGSRDIPEDERRLSQQSATSWSLMRTILFPVDRRSRRVGKKNRSRARGRRSRVSVTTGSCPWGPTELRGTEAIR